MGDVRVGSLFSGIGGFDLAFERAGCEVAWSCEIEAFPRKVLAQHWPSVPCYNDVRCADFAHVAPVDVLVGGFPCQDLSVAGKRMGIGGARSGLFFEFMRIASELKPKYVVIENVPGLLSSACGRDFAVVLDTLEKLGYGWAYRILDSQYFGVPQRRRRVFIVGCLGGQWECAAAVLFEPEGGGRDTQAGRQAGTDLTDTLGTSADRITGREGMLAPIVAPSRERERALTASMHKRHDEDTDTLIAISESGPGWRNEGIGALRAEGENRPSRPSTLIAHGLRASDGHHGHSSPRGDGCDNLVAATLNSGGNDGGFRTEPGEHLVAFQESQSGFREVAQHPTLDGNNGSRRHHGVMQSSGVRRLTPMECERLQAFPDGWTCLCGCQPYTTAACKCPDSPRYRALGNAVTVSTVEWIARRMRTWT